MGILPHPLNMEFH